MDPQPVAAAELQCPQREQQDGARERSNEPARSNDAPHPADSKPDHRGDSRAHGCEVVVVNDVEVHEGQEWQDDRGGDSEPEEPLRRAPGSDRRGNEQEHVEPQQVRHGPLEDHPPCLRIEPLSRPPEVPASEVPPRQPLGNRARSLDGVGVSRPQRSGEQRQDDDDDDPGIDPPPRRRVAAPRPGAVRKRGQDPEDRRRRLHEHPDETRRERCHKEEVVSPVAPEDHGVREPDRSGGREVLDHRGAAPDERKRRAGERDHRADTTCRPGHVAYEAPQQQSGQDEADEAGESKRGVLGNPQVHWERRERLEERELERRLERGSEDGELRVKKVDALLAELTSRPCRLRLAERVPLEQRRMQGRRHVHHQGRKHGDDRPDLSDALGGRGRAHPRPDRFRDNVSSLGRHSDKAVG